LQRRATSHYKRANTRVEYNVYGAEKVIQEKRPKLVNGKFVEY